MISIYLYDKDKGSKIDCITLTLTCTNSVTGVHDFVELFKSKKPYTGINMMAFLPMWEVRGELLRMFPSMYTGVMDVESTIRDIINNATSETAVSIKVRKRPKSITVE